MNVVPRQVVDRFYGWAVADGGVGFRMAMKLLGHRSSQHWRGLVVDGESDADAHCGQVGAIRPKPGELAATHGRGHQLIASSPRATKPWPLGRSPNEVARHPQIAESIWH